MVLWQNWAKLHSHTVHLYWLCLLRAFHCEALIYVSRGECGEQSQAAHSSKYKWKYGTLLCASTGTALRRKGGWPRQPSADGALEGLPKNHHPLQDLPSPSQHEVLNGRYSTGHKALSQPPYSTAPWRLAMPPAPGLSCVAEQRLLWPSVSGMFTAITYIQLNFYTKVCFMEVCFRAVLLQHAFWSAQTSNKNLLGEAYGKVNLEATHYSISHFLHLWVTLH